MLSEASLVAHMQRIRLQCRRPGLIPGSGRSPGEGNGKPLQHSWASSGGSSSKKSACQCRRPKGHEFDPCVGKISWRRKWQPTPVFLPGESYGQRSIVGYSPYGHKELDTDEAT